MAHIGILGGTFNPVHVGHVRLAIEMREALGLDAVEFLPAARPPHKIQEGVLPFSLRLELLQLALDGQPGLSINTVEAEFPGPSYTWDTLLHLRRTRPGVRWSFIMGAGDLLSLHLWKHGLQLGTLTSLAVANRDSLGAAEIGRYLARNPSLETSLLEEGRWRFPSGNELTLVDVPRLDISASFIRERFRRRANLTYLLPRTVEILLESVRDQALQAWEGRALCATTLSDCKDTPA